MIDTLENDLDRSIDWIGGADKIVIIDQTALPEDLVFKSIYRTPELVNSIRKLEIRGAPSLGVAGAMGVALSAKNHGAGSYKFKEEVDELAYCRPTAVNLKSSVDRMLALPEPSFDKYRIEALRIRDEEIEACYKMSVIGAEYIYSILFHDRLRLMTICNTGGLAAVERGTALGVIQAVHEDDRLDQVFVMETRPLLQGARLTTWELSRMGARFTLHVDSAGPALINMGKIDAVLVGADRITSGFHVANKIGTYALALAAKRHVIPFFVVAPDSTFDRDSGEIDIDIEYRSSQEVSKRWKAINPAFDITPPDLISAIITNSGVIIP